MPTINFTNATGSFTYTESTPPDPVEPPSTSTDGLIEGFNPSNGAMFTIGGMRVESQNADKAYCLKKTDDYTLRFEIHSGDRFMSSGHTDSTEVERTEVEWAKYDYPMDALLTNSYDFTLHDGPANTAAWIVMGQWHGTVAGNPPFIIGMQGDKMRISVRDSNNKEIYVYTDPQKTQRERKFQMRIENRFNPNGGTSKVWRDGEQIVNYNGSFAGAGNKFFWKNGIYRAQAPEIFAASYGHMKIEVR
jgi:hypothetical protein